MRKHCLGYFEHQWIERPANAEFPNPHYFCHSCGKRRVIAAPVSQKT